jgi:hypothetical protein
VRQRVEFPAGGPPSGDIPIVYEPGRPPAIPFQHYYELVVRHYELIKSPLGRCYGTVRNKFWLLEPHLRCWVSKERTTLDGLAAQGWLDSHANQVTLVPVAAAVQVTHDMGFSRGVVAAITQLHQRAQAPQVQPEQRLQPRLPMPQAGDANVAQPRVLQGQHQPAAAAQVLAAPSPPAPPPQQQQRVVLDLAAPSALPRQPAVPPQQPLVVAQAPAG